MIFGCRSSGCRPTGIDKLADSLKILLVEDNPGEARLVEELLLELGEPRHELFVADRLGKALELLAEASYDICLLDMGLPDSQGLKGLEQMQAAAPAMPVIIRTNQDDEALAISAVQHGAQDYLIKGPIEPQQFSRIIHYAIERKHIAEQVRDAELRYRTLFEQSPDGVVIIDPETSLPIEFNDMTCRQLGYTREEFARLRISDYEALETPEETFRHTENILRHGSDEFETKHVGKRGDVRDVRVSVQLISISGRKVLYCIFTDITASKRAEARITELAESLAAERDRLDIIMENSPQANLVYLDPDFNYLAVNSAYAESCRMSKEELIGRNHFLLFPDRENEAIFRRVKETGEAVEYTETPFQFPDQPWRGVTYWDWTLTPVVEPDGGINGLVFSLIDVTEKVRSRQFNIALNEIYSLINSTLDFNTIMHEVMMRAMRVLGAESCFLTVRRGSDFIIKYSHGREGISPQGTVLDASKAPVTWLALKSGRVEVVPDALSDTRLDRRRLKRLGVYSAVAAPLKVTDEIIGAISFTYHTGRVEFSPAQTDFMAKLSLSVALALQNSELYKNERESRAEVQGYAAQLSLLHSISLALNRETDTRNLQEMIVRQAAELTSAGVAVLLEVSETGAAISSVHLADWYEPHPIRIEDQVPELWRHVARLIEEDQYVIRLGDLGRLPWFPKTHVDLRELLFGILRDTRGRVRGLFMLGGKANGADFTPGDMDIVAQLAAASSVALTSAENFEREHYVAEVLQSTLLPEAPVNGNMDLGLLYRSASQLGRIGGDFYDFVELDDNTIAVAVGDVCGKGLNAANYTAMVKYMMRAYLDEDWDPGTCLTRLNRAIGKNLALEKFITMSLAVIRLKENTVTYALAGHPAPLAHSGQGVQHLDSLETLPLGVLPDFRFIAVTSEIPDAASLLMFTDGLIESRSPEGEQFGYQRLESAFADLAELPAQRLAQKLAEWVLRFTGDNLQDDMAIVVIKPGAVRPEPGA